MAVNSTTSHPPPRSSPLNASSDLARDALLSPSMTTPTATPTATPIATATATPTATATATPIATATATIDLTQHSLHAVLARDKTLWQKPIKWTRAHLLALGVQHSRRRKRCGDEEEDSSDSEQEGDCDRGDGDDEEETHHAVVPDLAEETLGLKVRGMTRGVPYDSRVHFITALLRGPRRFVPFIPVEGEGEQIIDGVLYRPFTILWTTPRLAVGPRTYKLHFLYHFLLGDKLVLPYLDSSAVLRPRWPVKRRRDRIRPFEPFITAVLIGRAQSLCSNSSGTGDKNTESGDTDANKYITTQLLFTHRDEKKYIHVYTAHISHALLDRFRHPNRPPATASTDPLIRLDHRCIPYEPPNTFRERLLAAVSVTAVLKSTAAPSRKRPPSPDACADTVVKRPHLLSEHPRSPLSCLDVNLERNSCLL